MKCSRTACQAPLAGETTVFIYNEPSTGIPRPYCNGCGMRIIRFNEQDTLKLDYYVQDYEGNVLTCRPANLNVSPITRV